MVFNSQYIFTLIENQFGEDSLIISLMVLILVCLVTSYLAYKFYCSHLKLKTQTNELEKYIQSNIKLEEFAHIASHDLRSPLRTVLSYTGLIMNKYGDKIDDEFKGYLKYVQKGAKQMDHLTVDLLEFAEINSMNLDIDTFDARSMIQDIVDILEYDIREYKAKIILENLPDKLHGDKQKLQRVFHNLISNSLKFVNTDIQPSIKISCLQKGENFIFVVKDNGIGIDVSYQKRIFNPFNRLNTQESYQGSGLGLAMSKQIIEQHKGKIWVKSFPGKGSTFFFTIPRNGYELRYDAKKELLIY